MEIIAIFVVVVVVVTVVLDRFIQKPAITVLITVPVCVVGFQLIAYIKLGHIDPFFHIAAAVQSLIAIGVSIGTIFLTRIFLKKGKPGTEKNSR